MIFFVCTCRLVLTVAGEPEEVRVLLGEESRWYPDRYPCPHCGKGMRYAEAIPEHDLAGCERHSLTPIEAFSALEGLGLPSERDCGETAVRKILLEQRITAVEAKPIRGTNRTVLYSLTFDDGTRLYLGSGPEGAVVYRIAQRVVDSVEV